MHLYSLKKKNSSELFLKVVYKNFDAKKWDLPSLCKQWTAPGGTGGCSPSLIEATCALLWSDKELRTEADKHISHSVMATGQHVLSSLSVRDDNIYILQTKSLACKVLELTSLTSYEHVSPASAQLCLISQDWIWFTSLPFTSSQVMPNNLWDRQGLLCQSPQIQ